MKLRFSPTSPFVRKVMVTAHETGQADKLEPVPTNPWDPETDLPKDNPLGKVPALVTDMGETLYDSIVICEFLDSRHDGPQIFPADGVARWKALKLHALGDGILEAAVLRFIETARRPEEFRWAPWIERQNGKMAAAFDWMEANADSLTGPVTIGHIALGCALGYADFRFPEDDWRGKRPKLTDWYDTFAERESMQATVPQDPS
ncbi:MAG: glutathione S-transferase [Rhodovibrionaceae bacterium]|nr:glutathione S-transferase [Rhodovibrionaceae bacterium]